MNLFDKIPEKLFVLLAGKNRKIYAEALFLLLEWHQKGGLGTEYNEMREALCAMLEKNEEKGISLDLSDENACENIENNPREKAGIILRRLKELEWIQIERRESFQDYIVLPNYTSRLLRTFKALCEEQNIEYQGYALNTYQLLMGEEVTHNPLTIIQAAKSTEELLHNLRDMNSNMHNHMSQLQKSETLENAFDQHLSYQEKIIDQGYHRLKTSNHTARYRKKILDIVEKLIDNNTTLERLSQEAVKSKIETFQGHNQEECKGRILDMLYDIQDFYIRTLDDIEHNIDTRHSKYTAVLKERIKYMSRSSDAIDQKLANILECLKNNSIPDAALEFAGNFVWIRQLSGQEEDLYIPRKPAVKHYPPEQIQQERDREQETIIHQKFQKKIAQAIYNVPRELDTEFKN